jgi:hypothetical protein
VVEVVVRDQDELQIFDRDAVPADFAARGCEGVLVQGPVSISVSGSPRAARR